MSSKLKAPFLASLVLLIPHPASDQAPTPKPQAAKLSAPGLIRLNGDDEKRGKEPEEQIEKALNANHRDEAIARAEELLSLRSKVQGPKHFETVDAEWPLKTLRR